jgi:hypothetical protein
LKQKTIRKNELKINTETYLHSEDLAFGKVGFHESSFSKVSRLTTGRYFTASPGKTATYPIKKKTDAIYTM